VAGPRRQCAVSGACRQPAGADRVSGGLETCTRPAMHRPQRRRKWVKGGTSGPVDPPLGGGQEEPPSKVRHTGCTCPPVKVWWCTPPHFSCTPCQQPRFVRIVGRSTSLSETKFRALSGIRPEECPGESRNGHVRHAWPSISWFLGPKRPVCLSLLGRRPVRTLDDCSHSVELGMHLVRAGHCSRRPYGHAPVFLRASALACSPVSGRMSRIHFVAHEVQCPMHSTAGHQNASTCHRNAQENKERGTQCALPT